MYSLLDEQFDRQVRKHSGAEFERPRYLNICLKRDTDLTELVLVSFFGTAKPTLKIIIISLFFRKSKKLST